MFRGLVTQWGNPIFVYIGDGELHRFNLEILEVVELDLASRELEARVNGQEVES